MAVPVEISPRGDARGIPPVHEWMRWGGWWIVIACVLARCLISPDPFPYWGTDPGRLIIPVGSDREQKLMRITRRGETFERESLGPVTFVPLLQGLS